jgi:TorA maturation chaperone TorD
MNAMAEKAQSIQFESPRVLGPEDRARADFYALLASLFAGAPDDRLLQAIVISGEPVGEVESDLTRAWRGLSAASAVVTHEAVEGEYETLFVGVGRPPVMLYGSYYLAGFMMEKPLAELRDDLAALGFARDPSVRESEDHLAALCDVMRALILGDLADAPAGADQQKTFFMRHIQPWVAKCGAAIVEHENANYYRRVAQFALAFFAMESEAFEMQ